MYFLKKIALYLSQCREMAPEKSLSRLGAEEIGTFTLFGPATYASAKTVMA